MIVTDHTALQYLLEKKGEAHGRMARWIDIFSEFYCKIFYRKGSEHVVPDALSRNPVDPAPEEEIDPSDMSWRQTPVLNIRHVNEFPLREKITVCRNARLRDEQIFLATRDAKFESISQSQKDCPMLSELRRCINDDVLPRIDFMPNDASWQKYVTAFDQMFIDNDVLHTRKGDDDSIKLRLIPIASGQYWAQKSHDSINHLGFQKTYDLMKDRFWYPGMRKDVKIYCRTCELCQRIKPQPHAPRAPMQISNEPRGPFSRIAMDFVGPLTLSKRRNLYALVIQDYYTKWPIVVALPAMDAKLVAQALYNHVITVHGVPDEIHTDQGKSFDNRIIHELCKRMGIVKTRTTPYHPQSDGLVERFNRTLKSLVTVLTEMNGEDWETVIPDALMSYRTTVHATTGFTPFYMVYGRDPVAIIDAELPLPNQPRTSHQRYADELQKRRMQMATVVRDIVPARRAAQKVQHDRRTHFHGYQIADKVWLEIYAKKPGEKFTANHEGPYVIDEDMKNGAYRIKRLSDGKTRTAHHDKLKPYHAPRTQDTNDAAVEKPKKNHPPSDDVRIADRYNLRQQSRINYAVHRILY